MKIIVGKSEFYKKVLYIAKAPPAFLRLYGKTPPRNSRKMETTVQKMAIYGQKRFRLFSALKRQKWLFYVVEKKHNSRKKAPSSSLRKLEKNGSNGSSVTKKGYILRKNNARGGGATAKTPPRNGSKMEMTVQKMAIYGQKVLLPFSPLKRQKWLFYVAQKNGNGSRVKFVDKFTNSQ